MMRRKNTSWDKAATWYRGHLKTDNYHHRVVLPGVQKLISDYSKGKKQINLLDVACGDGVLCDYLPRELKVNYLGVDLSPQLIGAARVRHKAPNLQFKVADARSMASDLNFSPKSDIAVCIFGLQNFDDLPATAKQIAQALKPGGKFIAVITHPAYRIPKHSDWHQNKQQKQVSRVVWNYLSPIQIPIQLRPHKSKFSRVEDATTWTYHRPLQDYVSALTAAGMATVDIQEWIANRRSEKGNPWAKAEDTARQEIPMFMCLVAQKHN